MAWLLTWARRELLTDQFLKMRGAADHVRPGFWVGEPGVVLLIQLDPAPRGNPAAWSRCRASAIYWIKACPCSGASPEPGSDSEEAWPFEIKETNFVSQSSASISPAFSVFMWYLISQGLAGETGRPEPLPGCGGGTGSPQNNGKSGSALLLTSSLGWRRVGRQGSRQKDSTPLLRFSVPTTAFTELFLFA